MADAIFALEFVVALAEAGFLIEHAASTPVGLLFSRGERTFRITYNGISTGAVEAAEWLREQPDWRLQPSRRSLWCDLYTSGIGRTSRVGFVPQVRPENWGDGGFNAAYAFTTVESGVELLVAALDEIHTLIDMGHFIRRCPCGTVVRACRCPAPVGEQKTEIVEICEHCRKRAARAEEIAKRNAAGS